MIRTPNITKQTAFTLLVPVLAYDEDNNPIQILQTDITNITNATLVNRLSSTATEGLPDGVTVSATSGGIQVVSSAGLPTGYYSFFVQCMVRNLLTTINIQNALSVSEFTPKKGNNTNINLTTQPVLLSNYTTLAQDEQTQARIDLLTDQLAEKTAENNALTNTLETRNEELNARTTQFNALNANYSDLLARYNALINEGGVQPDTPSGDTTPIPGVDNWEFMTDDGAVTPKNIQELFMQRTNLLSVPDFDLEEVAQNYMFANCVRLMSFTNTHIKRISGSYTFSGCSQLQSVNLPSATSISGSYTFSGCSQLQSVNLPSATSISGNNTFQGCSQLQSVNLPSATSISGNNTFSGCSQLQSVNLPAATSISGNNTFQGCSQLQSLIALECTSLSGGATNFFQGVTRLAYIKMGAASLSFSLSGWNPTYWTGTPSADDIAELIDLATEQWEEQNTTDPYPGRANNAIDALAVLFYLGIISRIRDLRDFGENVTSTLTLAAAFKTKLATSPLWSGYVAEANTKGWSIA